MSFKCEFCAKPQAPRVKPVMVVPLISRREMTYSGTFINKDEEVQEFVSSGWEAEHEFLSCPTCAGAPRPLPPSKLPLTLADMRALGSPVAPAVVHARSCKKLLTECKKCQNIVAMYSGLPLNSLNVVVSEPQTKGVGVTIGSLALYNASTRAHHNSNRAMRDVEAALPLTQGFRN